MSKNQYTPEQNKAIEFFPTHPIKKHLVIEAGAGSGKTTILKERVKFLLVTKAFLPEDLIVITFTKNSTAELKHRISQLQGENNLAEKVNFIHISTMDSFFASLVESLYPIWWDAHAHLEKKIPAQLALLDENHAFIDLEKYLKNAMEEFGPYEMREIADFILAGGLENNENALAKRSPLQSLLSAMLSDVFLSSHLNHIRISAQTIHPATQKIIEKCYKIARFAYEKRIESGTFTYQDRNVFLQENLHLSCPLFFKELIVDEYQDTNHIQHAILWKLVELNKAQMTVVGDPKQSIYAFRGSNVDVFQSLLNDEQWNVISLDVNFRSTSKLLNEVNILSHLSFDWQTSNLPELFKSSFFYYEAIKKSIGHKALKAGNMAVETLHVPTVTLFEYSDPKDDKKSAEYKEHSTKREFNENNIKSLGHYLIGQINQNAFQWKDVAILCEKNKQIAKIKKIFAELQIPFAADSQNDKFHGKSFVDILSLSLFHILHEGIDAHNMNLFYVLISPLTKCTFQKVLFYFLNSNSHDENIQKVLNILKKYHEKAQHQFFIAWQNCRFELANLCVSETGKNDALIFCRHMDDFAEKIFSLSQVEGMIEIKKILSLPSVPNKKSTLSNETENALSIKTVHGAKGLEWDVVCFYPTTSRYESPEPFSVSNSWPYLDINWLSEDIKSLSYLQKQKNEKFTEIDNHYNEEKEKHVWFSDLRNQLEKNFERKRIFYTAFTRPRKKLIFMHPERQGANSARQLDKKFDFHGYEKNFEQDVFLKYAYLTRENKAQANHIKFYFNPVLSSDLPLSHHTLSLTENNDSVLEAPEVSQGSVNKVFSEAHEVHVCVARLRGTPSPEGVLGCRVLGGHTSDEVTMLRAHAQCGASEKLCSQNLKMQTILEEKNPAQELSASCQILSTPLSLIQQKQKRRRAAHTGILFHVKSENNFYPHNLGSVHYLIHSHALKIWTEFEIWNRENEIFPLERRIIDLLAVFEKATFEKILADISISCSYFKTHISNSSDYVFFIVDFKTGILSNSSVKQIENYALLIEKMCLSGWFQAIIKNSHVPNISLALIK